MSRFHPLRSVTLLSLATLIFALVTFQEVEAATLIVTSTADSGPGSLRETIAAASDGDIIQFDSTLNGQTITLTSGLAISRNLSVEGPGANLLIVRRSNAPDTPAFSVFTIYGSLGRSVSIAGLTIANGNANLGGGILSGAYSLNISNCAISDNHAQTGGGIYCAGGGAGSIHVTITNTTISGNTAENAGGVYVGAGADGSFLYPYGCYLTLSNSTISGNLATSMGGGILLISSSMLFTGSGELTMVSTTVTANSADEGGGIYAQDLGPQNAVRESKNSIIASNTASVGPDIKGGLTSNGFNLIGNNSAGTISPIQASDQIGSSASPIDPLLGPLQNNGGPTLTHALLPGGPAIDKGESSGSMTDQRNFVRPVDFPSIPNVTGGDGADIGAFEAQAATLANISTRLHVQTGNSAMIGGFIITGTEPKTVIVRGIGPSLLLPGALADPVIEVHGAAGELLASNDDWGDDPNFQHVIDSGLAPSNAVESALWGIINPGAYTVVVRGKDNTTGIGLFEVYDLDQRVNSKLGNISTRGFVETGNNVMIGGMIILGNNPARILFRAIGPSLTNFGVSDALPDPILELHDGNGALLASNDNWRSDQEAEIIATGISPTNDLESAILQDLGPGNYTAIVRGVNGMTGVAVVEAYGLN